MARVRGHHASFPQRSRPGLGWAGAGRGGGGFFLGWGLGIQRRVGRAWGRHHLHGLRGSDMGPEALAYS